MPGRCALITGSTAGLGLAIADRLAAEGCRIVLTGLAGPEELERARGELVGKRGDDVRCHGADLRDPAAIEDLMDFAGGVDILVNNAVTRHFSPIEDFPPERWNEALAVNLSAAFHTVRLALPGMRSNGFGRIVNIASVYSFVAAANRIDYVTTKTAILGLTRAVAIEIAGTGITCNAVAPGVLPTPAILGRMNEMAAQRNAPVEEVTRDYVARHQPGGTFIAMENVAALVAFLCGPAGQDITGAVFPVDGGWTIK